MDQAGVQEWIRRVPPFVCRPSRASVTTLLVACVSVCSLLILTPHSARSAEFGAEPWIKGFVSTFLTVAVSVSSTLTLVVSTFNMRAVGLTALVAASVVGVAVFPDSREMFWLRLQLEAFDEDVPSLPGSVTASGLKP